jgi:type I restriction enzyme S subunit
MGIQQEFKKTEVGIIPSDWEVALTASLLSLPIQNGVFNEPSRKGKGLKLINVIDLYGNFPINTKNLERFNASKEEILRFVVKHGDLFFTRSSLTPEGIARCNVYSGDGNEEVVFDCHIIRARPNSNKAEPFYLARYCNSRPARAYLIANAKTTTMTTIDQSVVAKLPVALPPLPEQRAIATALSDVDELLAGLTQLIAKKRDLKQAAMQQLLTGKTRLPGFSGAWEVKRLGDAFTITVGKSKSAYVVKDGDFWACDMGSVSIKGRLIVSKRTNYHSDFLKRGDLIMPKDDIGGGNIIGKVGYIDADDTYILGDHVYCLRALEGDPRFLAYVINSHRVNSEFRKKVIGSAQLGLARKSVNEQEIIFPSPPEQTAIAEVLSDMDAEIATLEARLEKTRFLKQGMMQELLTGRIRLI